MTPSLGDVDMTMTITNDRGRQIVVRIIRVGDAYGLTGSLTVEDGDQVEFYDTTYANKRGFGPWGQFVTRYYISTLLETSVGLDLNGGVDHWKIDPSSMDLVRSWLRHEAVLTTADTEGSP